MTLTANPHVEVFLSLAASSGSSLAAPALVAALVAAAVSLATFALAGRRARLDRQRQLFAEAFQTTSEYCEYPFIVRRRREDRLAEERARISSDLSKVQAKLNSYRALLRVEAPEVGARYAELVDATRRIAGAKIRDAWDADPIGADSRMHGLGIEFGDLHLYEQGYLEAVSDHLAWSSAPVRRWSRRTRSHLRRTRSSSPHQTEVSAKPD